jgi:hypothetical protein
MLQKPRDLAGVTGDKKSLPEAERERKLSSSSFLSLFFPLCADGAENPDFREAREGLLQ